MSWFIKKLDYRIRKDDEIEGAVWEAWRWAAKPDEIVIRLHIDGVIYSAASWIYLLKRNSR